MDFTKEQQLVVNETNEYISNIHGTKFNKEDGKKLAKLYFESVDKEGFCFDFDDIWSLCGYTRKDNAKKKLISTKNKLLENVDYKISLRHSQDREHGGNNREIIMLTSRCFCQFALTAATDNGVVLRDFIQYMTSRFSILLKHLAANDVQIRHPIGDGRPAKRIKACETQKSLMSVVNELEIKNPNPYIFANINAKTNHTILGKTKKDLIKELHEQKDLKKIPKTINARDYMSEIQLNATALLESASSDKLLENKPDTTKGVLNCHATTCDDFFTESAKAYIRNKSVDVAHTLNQARKSIALEDNNSNKKRKIQDREDPKQQSIMNMFRQNSSPPLRFEP